MNPEENKNPKEESGFGPSVGIFLIIVLMIFGAIYYTMNEAQSLGARKKAYEQALAASTTTQIIFSTTTEATTTP